MGLSEKGDEANEYDVHRATVTHIEGETIIFTPMSPQNFHLEKEVSVDTIFPLIYAEHVNDVSVENLVLDSNSPNNSHCSGNFSGAVLRNSAIGGNSRILLPETTMAMVSVFRRLIILLLIIVLQ